MSCMCGGCKGCLADQGYGDFPETCPVCGSELGEDDGSFCSPSCAAKYDADMKAEDDALAAELAEEAALVAAWKASQKVT